MRSDMQPKTRKEKTRAGGHRRHRLLVGVLFAGAFLIAIYMAWQSLSGRGLAGCGPESECEIVLASRWGSFLGVPVSVFGAVVYGFLLGCELPRREKSPFDLRLQGIAGALVLAGALWFAFVQAVLLRAFCPWCSAAHALAGGGVLIRWMTNGQKGGASVPRLRLFSSGAVASAVAAVAGMAAIQTYRPAPEHIRRVSIDPGNSSGITQMGWEDIIGAGLSELPRIGALDASETWIALTDFTCPHCRQLEQVLAEAVAEMPGRLSVVMLPAYHETEARELHRVMLALWKIDRDLHREVSHAVVEGAIEASAAAVTEVIEGQLDGPFYEMAWPHGEWIEDTLAMGKETMSRNERLFELYTLPQLMIGDEVIAGPPSLETVVSLMRASSTDPPEVAVTSVADSPDRDSGASPVGAAARASGDVVAALGTSSALPGPQPAVGPAIGPRIEFEKETIDMGRVDRGDKVPFVVRFTNTGDAPLEITKIKPSCACTTVEGWEQTVLPGESGSIELKFDSGYFVGEVSKSIAVEASDPRGNGSVKFKANVWTPVVLSPRMVLFGLVLKGIPVAPRTVEIAVQDDEPIEIGEISCDNSYFQWSLETIEKGRRYALTVAVPELGETSQQGEIKIPVGHSKLAEVMLPLTIAPVNAVRVQPPEISLSAAISAEPQVTGVRVECFDRSLTKLEITDLNYTGDAEVEVTLDSSWGSWWRLNLTLPAGYDAAAEQTRGAHVTFRTNHPDYPEIHVPIRTADAGR